MLSDDGSGQNILEVHAHNEQWSFVNGGAEVCSILFMIQRTWNIHIVCQRPVKGRYVSLIGGGIAAVHLWQMIIYSKCKYICSFKC